MESNLCADVVRSSHRPQAWRCAPPPSAAKGLTSPHRTNIWPPSLRWRALSKGLLIEQRHQEPKHLLEHNPDVPIPRGRHSVMLREFGSFSRSKTHGRMRAMAHPRKSRERGSTDGAVSEGSFDEPRSTDPI